MVHRWRSVAHGCTMCAVENGLLEGEEGGKALALEFGPTGDRSGAVVDAELVVDGPQMLGDGPATDEERFASLGVGHALGDEFQHLDLAIGEAGGMVGRAAAKSGFDLRRREPAIGFAPNCSQIPRASRSRRLASWVSFRADGEFGEGKRRKRLFVGRFATFGKLQRCLKVIGSFVVVPDVGIHLAEQAMGGDERQWLAGSEACSRARSACSRA